MEKYTDRVARNLEGCQAVSTGVCPGCDECRSNFREYSVREFENPDGSPYWSFDATAEKHAPGILTAYPSEDAAEAASRERFAEDYYSGDVVSEPSFSWSQCDICGSSLGGYREDWHYVDPEGKIKHCANGACVDCVCYLANGDEPPEPEPDEPEDLDPDEPDEPDPKAPDKPTNGVDLGSLDEFTRAYLETALWATSDNSTPQGGEPLDANYTPANIHPDSVAEIVKLCAQFQADHSDDLATCQVYGPDFGPAGHGGHDLFLTRNGHGAGYWDGDYNREAGERLTKAAHKLGESAPYIGDDRFLHFP